MTHPKVLTIGDAARHFGCEGWQVRRCFERGLLPPAARLGAYRIIDARDLPKVEAALRGAGYLPMLEASSAR
jgi:DNA-binding transcriptional MerR regulator